MKKSLVIVTLTTLLVPLTSLADRAGNMQLSMGGGGMGMSMGGSDKGMSKGGNDMGMSKGMSGMSMQGGNQKIGMKKMQDRMKNMTQQMDKIHQTRDSKKREKLINSHMDNIREGMMEMRSMGGGMMMGMMGHEKGAGMMNNGNMMSENRMGKNLGNDQMMMRMNNMQNRMDMMQMMMEQIVESREAERSLHQDDHMK